AGGSPGPRAAEGPPAPVERDGRQEPGKPQESGKPGESEWPEGAAGPVGTWLWGEGAESSVMVVTACRVRGQ
ncbi:hypothetical protein ACFWYA_29805, partial [Streptomyces sp. NPDC059011]